MSDFSMLLRGMIIGFSIAAPVGPIGLLCIRRTLAFGRVCGLISGLGAATADAIYGTIAALGLTVISSFLIHQQNWLRLVGGIFLCYLGLITFLAKPVPQDGSNRSSAVESNQPGLVGAYASTLFLTLTNPLTILSFTAVFAGLGLASSTIGYLEPLLLVGGVFLGSALWWFLLSGLTDVLRTRLLKPTGLLWVNRISGTLIAGFGMLAILSLR